ncbi:MAG: DUF5317 domain-containing protein [Anaerolineaceae bacterium]|jgi:hypothetical protein
MVLVAAVIIGSLLGIGRAWINKQEYRVYDLKAPALVLLAFLPQFLIFYLPSTRSRIPETTASILFVSSLTILIAFSLLNIRKASFWPVISGFLLNVAVILLNGGWMPISPQTAQKIMPAGSVDLLKIGQRIGYSKDILLTREETRLWFLSDRLTLPQWVNYGVAFSVGDLLLFIGIIWLLWSLGGKASVVHKEI